MKCSRCRKEFQFEFLSIQHWLKHSRLDNDQLSFLLYNFGGPLCNECEEDLISSFYLYGINPNRKVFRKIH